MPYSIGLSLRTTKGRTPAAMLLWQAGTVIAELHLNDIFAAGALLSRVAEKVIRLPGGKLAISSFQGAIFIPKKKGVF